MNDPTPEPKHDNDSERRAHQGHALDDEYDNQEDER